VDRVSVTDVGPAVILIADNDLTIAGRSRSRDVDGANAACRLEAGADRLTHTAHHGVRHSTQASTTMIRCGYTLA